MIDFIILGAQKAATSALQNSLRLHHCIHMPKGESPFFEDPDFASRGWETFVGNAPTDLVTGIKRPDYLCSDLARERITTTLPDCKFIVVLREPLSRTISSYYYMVRHAHLPAAPLNEGLDYCLRDFEAGIASRAATVISYSLYGTYLEKWFDACGSERFLILSQAEVGSDLHGVLKKCLHHLGVPADQQDIVPTAAAESNLGLYDFEMLKIARIGSLLKTRPIHGTYRREPRVLPMRAVGALISRYAEIRARSRKQQREGLSEQLRNRLARIFDEDIERLAAMIDTAEFGWTKNDEAV